MTDLLRLAAALRRADDSLLERVVTERMVNSSSLVDLIDLAEALLNPKSLTPTLAGLPRKQVEALITIGSGEYGNPLEADPIADSLVEAFLVERTDSGLRLYEPVKDALDALLAAGPGAKPVTGLIAIVADATDLHAVDRESGINAFETLQALTEIVFDLEQRWVREVGKRSVGLPDIKRLANHLGKTNDFARGVYDIADLGGLMVLSGGRWVLGHESETWLKAQPTDRWLLLAKLWRRILGDFSANQLRQELSVSRNIESLLKQNYPLADNSVSSKIHRLVAFANQIGLTSNSIASSWFELVLDDDFGAAEKMLAAHLPATQNRLICQADLSLVAPGPLPTNLEIELRRFAETEQIGMASTYRMSPISVSHGLETGLTGAGIRELLLELSGKALPQPVEYLISETEQRFGRLRISAGTGDQSSIIRCSDRVVIATLANDTRLRPLSLRPIVPSAGAAMDEPALTSRFDPEVVYYQLRDVGFVAVRVDENDQVISPRVSATGANAAVRNSTVAQDIARMREQDNKVSTEPDTDDVLRQIQLALKNKTRLMVKVVNATGAEIDYLLEPIGIANGRLRAKDKNADIERTLPLTSIIAVALG